MNNPTDFIESIAVIGLSGRFPGAGNIDQFWRNLRDGVEAISIYTDDELESQGVPPKVFNDPNYVKAEFFLEDVDMFDASFFGFSPREAEIIDPQHRIFLESAWEALESSGYDPETFGGLIGVYAGASMNDYIFNLYSRQETNDPAGTYRKMIGVDKDYLTTRVSYKLNLKGPSLTIQTACSTSLVAVHLACQGLLSYQCDMALAGGVCINLPQRRGYLYQEGMILSPDGHCRAFDAKAQGTVSGQGVGIVVLKRLSEALEDRDTIHAVIKGSAINNDGAHKVGFTAPGIEGQAEVIATALALAQIDPETITYIEAHGTGTPLGDPIEIAALTQVFRTNTQKKGFCAIGSVKGNVGHLDAAAGVTGLIKTVLALKHKEIPPSLHFENPNPEIDFENSPFYVNNRLTEWHTDGTPRRAGVSSFGIGGTNAHMVLEEAPVLPAPDKSRPYQLLLISAKTGSALETATGNLSAHLKQHVHLNLADVAYTLQVGRKAFSHRRMIVCRDCDDAGSTLETLDSKRVITSFQGPVTRDIVFMFSGQGSQYVNMGLELYKTETRFRAEIDRCSEILETHLSLDLRNILYPDEGNTEEASRKLGQTFITQTALFAIEYALARLWMTWGIHPKAFIGHSLGEYVAACLSGVFSLRDALSVVAARGRLMQELPEGSMLAVFLSEKDIQPYLNERISLAVINGPSLCVVSGEKEAIKDMEKDISGKNVNCRRLHTSHAFHSRMMEPILTEFTNHVKRVGLNPPRIPFVSNLTGTWITSDEATNPDYWAGHLRRTVRFSDGIQELLKEPDRVLLEVGPGHTLNILSRQHPDRKGQMVLSSIRHPKEKLPDAAFILNTLGRLWLAGIKVDWPGFYADESRQRISLPTYPFERKRHWIDAGKQICAGASAAPRPSKEIEKAPLSSPTQKKPKINNTYDDAPGNDIEQGVASIWQELLGVEQVGIHDNFFDLGGSSLIAVSLFAQIEKVFGKKLPVSILYELPTVEQLAGILHKKEGTEPWSSIVNIRSGSTKPPLFLVHAAYGNVLNYRALASHLGPDQPVYGLQARGLNGKEPFLTRIEEMAACYVSEVKNIQPEGPYLLGGYCLGGTIALEMARQFRAQGQEVPLLALLETYNWANLPVMSLPVNIRHQLQKIKFHWRNFLLLDSEGKNLFFREKMNELRRRSKLWYGPVISRISDNGQSNNREHLLLSRLWQINDQAAQRYVPGFYQGRISLFLPVKRYTIHDTPEMMWNEMAEEIEIHELPVYPAGSLVEPFVRILADKLEGCINKALEPELSEQKRNVSSGICEEAYNFTQE